MKVAAYVLKGNGHAERLVPLMAKGAKAVGDEVTIFSDKEFKPEHTQEYEVAVFWGYVETCQAIMAAYKNNKAAVYLDLGYWDRGNYFKVSVNDRHPTAYFQQRSRANVRRIERFVGLNTPLLAPRVNPPNAPIVVAGLSVKAAWAENLGPIGAYDARLVEEIRKHTTRPIIYRPKSKDPNTPSIPGTTLNSYQTPISKVLAYAHALVTHHSNAGVDAVVAAVPVHSVKGVASVFSVSLEEIDVPPLKYVPGERILWACDLAYCQWTAQEMADGTCWRYLKDEGLVP